MERGRFPREWKVKRKPVPQTDDDALPPSHDQPQHHVLHRNRAADRRPLIQLEDYGGNGGSPTGAPAPDDETLGASGTSGISASWDINNGAIQKKSPWAYAHSSPSSETDEARDTRESKPEPPGINPLKSQPWKTVLFAWLGELIWSIISLASLVALVALLHRFDKRPLPQWPLGLTLNTAIALLATFARAAFVIPVSESLSQLKWLWYLRARPLKDFQDFDAASRGVWGSIQLAKTTKGWSPSVISMVVLLTAILTSTLTQSTVTYPTRFTPILPKPVVASAVRFIAEDYDTSSYLMLERHLDPAIQAGLSHSPDSVFPFDQPVCSTTECVWDVVSTLGLCVKVWDTTELLNVTYGRRKMYTPNSPPTPTFASLPNGASSDLNDDMEKRGMVTLNSGQRPLYTYLDNPEVPETDIFDFTMIFSPPNAGRDVRATEAMLYFCVQQYNVSVHDNVVSRELIGTTADIVEVNTNALLGTAIAGLKVPGEPDTKLLYGGRGPWWLRQSLAFAFKGTFSQLSSNRSEQGRAPARYLYALFPNDTETYEQNVVEVVFNVTNNVARSLTNMLSAQINTTNVLGEAFVTETYVKVRWAWLSFISAQIVLSIVVLAVAIILTRNAGLGVVKSSTIPAFFAIDAHDRELLDSRKGPGKQQVEIDSLLKDGLGTSWKLGLTDRGWMLHGR